MIRSTNVKPLKRSYSSDLRNQQAEATRTRILEALVRQMRNGVGTLSIPGIARDAGVSVPTIYRHFGSKQGLIDALAPHVSAHAGLMPNVLPEDVAGFESMAQAMFESLARMDLPLRAAMASDLGWEVRRAAMPARLAAVRQVIDRLAPEASRADRERLTQLALILMASPTFQAYHDYLDLGPEEAAKLVSWAVATLVTGLRGPNADASKRR